MSIGSAYVLSYVYRMWNTYIHACADAQAHTLLKMEETIILYFWSGLENNLLYLKKYENVILEPNPL